MTTANNKSPNHLYWEFLRRNPDYINDRQAYYQSDLNAAVFRRLLKQFNLFHKFQEELNKEYKQDRRRLRLSPKSKETLWVEIRDKYRLFILRKLQEKWHIRPTWNFDRLPDPEIPYASAEADRPQFEVLGIADCFQVIEIDEQSKLKLKNRNKIKRRKRSDKYTEYLKILELRNKGKPFSDIAKTLAPEEKNDYPDYSIADRFKKKFKAAKRTTSMLYEKPSIDLLDLRSKIGSPMSGDELKQYKKLQKKRRHLQKQQNRYLKK